LRTDAPTARGLRDRPLGKAAILLAVLLAAFVATKSCASRDTNVSKEKAAEIAREQVDFKPDRVMTRFVPRGVQSRPTWAVSFSKLDATGNYERITVVVVDAVTGDIIEIYVQGP
jgi:hypothetical protein